MMLSIAVTFALGYAISNFTHFFLANAFDYESWSRERVVGIVDEVRLGYILLKHGEVDGLRNRLAALRQAGTIDFYLVKRGGERLSFGNGGNTDEDWKAIDIPYVPNRIDVEKTFAYGTTAYGDYLLVVGIHQRRLQYLMEVFKRTDFLADIAMVALMAIGIVLFFFRDILQLIRVMRVRDRKGLEKLRQSSTTEAVIMVEGFRAYERQLEGLKNERKSLRGSLRQAVRTELDLGKKPPYQFGCVMVRTDINDYSVIYSTFPVEEFMSLINEFFSLASEVVARYGGYVTDFVGDEIIYYFKEEEHVNAAAVAISAVRDIHQLAAALDARVREVRGYPFLVKSAVAPGVLRFGAQVNGFALSGGVFVETVRILSQVTSPDEKAQNTVYLPDRLVSRVGLLCATEFRKAIELRGIPGLTQLHAVTEFVTCASLLSDLSQPVAKSLGHFRSDIDILAILKYGGENVRRKGAYSEIQAVVHALRSLRMPSSSILVQDAFLDFFEVLLDRDAEGAAAGNEGRLLYSTLLSSVISLAQRLLARDLYGRRLNRLFMRCFSVSDHRTVANAIDAFIHFDPSASQAVFGELMSHSDQRVVANVLVKQGLIRLGGEVISGLRDMIQSEKNPFQASGCYAIGELAQYYRAEDLPFYETHLPFRDLLSEVVDLTRHADPTVRRQAERALEKAEFVTGTVGASGDSPEDSEDKARAA
jgi:class 3 adenylate cyclase